MDDPVLHHERVTSWRTTAMFMALTNISLVLSFLAFFGSHRAWLTVGTLVLACFFGLCALNYRALEIRLTTRALALRYGLIRWTVPLAEIADWRIDRLPALLRYGGAGVHFMFVRGRYRISFNDLEHPRIVIALQRPRGLVCDVSFSTADPEGLLRALLGAIAARDDA